MESSNDVMNSAYEKMRALDTDALIRIRKEGDQSEYSVVEQEAARKVLSERLGGLSDESPVTGETVVAANTTVSAVVDDDEDDEEVVSSGSRWASFIATLAAVVSWPLLALFLGLGGFTFWQTIQQGQQMGASLDQLLLQLLNPLNYLLMGLFYFAVLQFVAKAISILQDIYEYAAYLVESRD